MAYETLLVETLSNGNKIKFMQGENHPDMWLLSYENDEVIFQMPFQLIDISKGGGDWDWSPMTEYVRKNIDKNFGY